MQGVFPSAPPATSMARPLSEEEEMFQKIKALMLNNATSTQGGDADERELWADLGRSLSQLSQQSWPSSDVSADDAEQPFVPDELDCRRLEGMMEELVCELLNRHKSVTGNLAPPVHSPGTGLNLSASMSSSWAWNEPEDGADQVVSGSSSAGPGRHSLSASMQTTIPRAHGDLSAAQCVSGDSMHPDDQPLTPTTQSYSNPSLANVATGRTPFPQSPSVIPLAATDGERHALASAPRAIPIKREFTAPSDDSLLAHFLANPTGILAAIQSGSIHPQNPAKRKRRDSKDETKGGQDTKLQELFPSSSRRRRRKRDKSADSIFKGATVWTDEAHLQLISESFRYLKQYRENLWSFVPLNPAVLDETNLRYILSTEEGASEVSALGLNLYVCLARGAVLEGRHDVAHEFIKRAEDQLDIIMEDPRALEDYSVALAVNSMAYHTLYWEMDNQKAVKRFKVAMAICQRINALNSDAYSRCLYAVPFLPTTTVEDVKALRLELERVKRLPYYKLTDAPNYVYRPSTWADQQQQQRQQDPTGEEGEEGAEETTTRDTEEGEGKTRTGEEGQEQQGKSTGERKKKRARPRFVPSIQQQMPLSLHNLCLFNYVAGVCASVHGAITLYKANVERSTPEQVQRLNQGLERILASVESLGEEVMRAASQYDPLPEPARNFIALFSIASKAELLWLVGRRAEALDWAIAFVRESADPKYRFLVPGIGLFVGFVMEILYESQCLDYMRALLATSRDWAFLIPLVKCLRTQYQAKLCAIETMQMAQSPSVSLLQAPPQSNHGCPLSSSPPFFVADRTTYMPATATPEHLASYAPSLAGFSVGFLEAQSGRQRARHAAPAPGGPSPSPAGAYTPFSQPQPAPPPTPHHHLQAQQRPAQQPAYAYAYHPQQQPQPPVVVSLEDASFVSYFGQEGPIAQGPFPSGTERMEFERDSARQLDGQAARIEALLLQLQRDEGSAKDAVDGFFV